MIQGSDAIWLRLISTHQILSRLARAFSRACHRVHVFVSSFDWLITLALSWQPYFARRPLLNGHPASRALLFVFSMYEGVRVFGISRRWPV